MSQATADELVVAGHQLTVTKQLDRERFKHLGVVYEIRSERDDTIDLRLIDTVPASVPVGFHPQYHGADWTMRDRTLVFERELGAGEELVTLYGLGTGAIESADRFRSEPTVEFRPAGETDFRRLDGGESQNGEPIQEASEPVQESTSISELAQALEADGREREQADPRPSVDAFDRSARHRIQLDDSELLPSLRESIDQLDAIADAVSSHSADDSTPALGRGAARFHLEAICFHVAHLREDLEIEASSVEAASTADPAEQDQLATESSEPDHVEPDSTVTEPAITDESRSVVPRLGGSLEGLPHPGQGLPFYWLVALLGITVVLAGVGVFGGARLDFLLAGIGGLITLTGVVAWIVPEEKLPLPALPFAVTLSGLFVLAHPFLFGRPRSIPGLLSLAAGSLITTIPMAVENRRGQLLGLLEN